MYQPTSSKRGCGGRINQCFRLFPFRLSEEIPEFSRLGPIPDEPMWFDIVLYTSFQIRFISCRAHVQRVSSCVFLRHKFCFGRANTSTHTNNCRTNNGCGWSHTVSCSPIPQGRRQGENRIMKEVLVCVVPVAVGQLCVRYDDATAEKGFGSAFPWLLHR